MKNRQMFTDDLIKYIDTPIIKIIIGIRRCGKTYTLRLLARELASRGISDSDIIKLDFESLATEPYRNYKALYKYVKEKAESKDSKIYILIDEVQEVEGWENAVRSFLVDFNCDIYLTGSNAHLLSGELATYLAGRYVELHLYPLSFKEYLDFNNVEFNDAGVPETIFYQYLKYGGFPGLHQLPEDDDIKRQYITGIQNSVVLKDVIQRNHIRDSELLERIYIYIQDNIGQLFSAKKIADYLKAQGFKAGVETIYNHIRALESAMVIYPARRYDLKGKRLLQRLEKYFIADLGLRYAVLGYRENDISQVLENVVFMELLSRGYKVYVGKEGDYEVDFIAEKPDKRIYIQVCYLLATAEVVEREYRPLKNIQDNYRKIVLSLDRMPIGESDGIKWMNLVDFLINNKPA